MQQKAKQLHELLFQNPVFHKGLNVTCRRGRKWYERIVAENADTVEIKETDGPSVGEGQIVGCKLVTWSDGDLAKLAGWLDFEHDPSCRTPTGLFTEMQRVYGQDWDIEPMTVVFFVPKE